MREKDLRTAILAELELSILEISPDFMLIPRKKQLSTDGEHRIVDLLFYHRTMQCMMPIYLTFGKLQIDDIEWMKANLQMLLAYNMRPGEHKPVGCILCVQDNNEHAELVTLEQSRGFIAKNLIEFPLKQIFKARLHEAVIIARKQLAAGAVSGGK